MKSPVRRIAIFRRAVVVERPVLHGGVGPVVRQAAHHGVAWSAVRAVDVRICVAADRRGRKVLRDTASQTGRSGEMRTVGRVCRWLSRMVNSLNADRALRARSALRRCWRREAIEFSGREQKHFRPARCLRDKSRRPLRRSEPIRPRVFARQADRRTGESRLPALRREPGWSRRWPSSIQRPPMQPRPCQPT